MMYIRMLCDLSVGTDSITEWVSNKRDKS